MYRYRMLIQLIFFIIANLDIRNLLHSIITRQASVGKLSTKYICFPGLHCYSCPAATSSCPIGSLQFWLNDIALRIQIGEKLNLAGLYIIGFLSATGIIGGRIFCGWVCPFGFIQDLGNSITKKNLKIPKIIKGFRYVSLFLFVLILPLLIYDITKLSPWFCKLLCPAGTLFAGLPLLAIDKTLRSAASLITLIKFIILFQFIASFFITKRGFCKTACPLGLLWGFFNKISILKININKKSCTKCGRCSNICPMQIDVTSNLNSIECIRCFKCIETCPSKSLTFGNRKGVGYKQC